MAAQEKRDTRAQGALLLHEGLKDRGLLAENGAAPVEVIGIKSNQIAVSDIAVLDIKPGQVLVLTVPERVRPSDTREAMQTLEKVFPGVHILVVHEGYAFSVIDRSEIPLPP